MRLGRVKINFPSALNFFVYLQNAKKYHHERIIYHELTFKKKRAVQADK